MRAARVSALALVLLLVPFLADAGTVHVATVSGGINPAVSDYLQKAVDRAADDGAEALVIQLDTPGGLVSSTKDIVTAILNAEVAVIVFVSPRGAWAASAGTFITMAGHVAAMAPGTSIGAASPVPVFGGAPPAPPDAEEGDDKEKPAEPQRDTASKKAENYVTAFIQSIAEERDRNVDFVTKAVREAKAITQKEALEENVIDLVADDLDHLLELVHGRTVKVGREEVTLDTEGASIVEVRMDLVNRIFDVISEPQIALLLILAGLLGLYVEFTQPGMIFPGVAGLIALLLAGFALQVIPFNWIGLVLILGGIGLLVAEVFVTSFGVLFGSGVLCVGLGAFLLFDVPEQSTLRVPFWSVIFPAVAGMAVFGGIVVFGLSRSLFQRQVAGAEGLVGDTALVDSDIAPEGRVFLHGEFWTARADEPIQKGERVEITQVSDLIVHVRRRSEDPEESST